MSDTIEPERVMLAGNLPSYFHDAVATAMDKRELETADATKWYLANLLARFAHSDRFFDYSQDAGTNLRPLALMYADAIEASSEGERRLTLQRMGDVALFVAALFEGLLSRRGVKRDYFVAMGCGAYAYLADNPVSGGDETVFNDLSSRFVLFVDVLSTVSATGKRFDQAEILRLYRLWRETGSPLAERQLRALGVSLDIRARTH